MEEYKVVLPGFDSYMSAADQTSKALLTSSNELVEGIRQLDDFYRSELLPNNPRIDPISMFLVSNASLAYYRVSEWRLVVTQHPSSLC